PDAVAAAHLTFDDRFVVDERAVARRPVAQHDPLAVDDNLGVFARDFARRQLQVVAVAPSNGERRAVDDDLSLVADVAHPQPGERHAAESLADPRRPANARGTRSPAR